MYWVIVVVVIVVAVVVCFFSMFYVLNVMIYIHVLCMLYVSVEMEIVNNK